MMVEQEALAEETPEPGQQPVCLRRIARMDDVEAASGDGDLDGQDEAAQEAPRELQGEARSALGVDR